MEQKWKITNCICCWHSWSGCITSALIFSIMFLLPSLYWKSFVFVFLLGLHLPGVGPAIVIGPSHLTCKQTSLSCKYFIKHEVVVRTGYSCRTTWVSCIHYCIFFVTLLLLLLLQKTESIISTSSKK